MSHSIKISLTFFFLAGMAVSVCGQIEWRTVPLGGGLSVQRTTAGADYRSFATTIAPYAGYYFNDNFGIAGGCSFSDVNVDIQNFPVDGATFESSQQQLAIFLAPRLYFSFLDFRVFAQGNLSSTSTTTDSDNWTNLDMNFGLGANGWLNDNIAVEGQVRYGVLHHDGLNAFSTTFEGPLELTIDIRPYLIEKGDPPSYLADEFLDAGSWHLGGGFGITHDLAQKLNTWLAPRVGYFVQKNFLTGMDFSFSYTDNRTNNPVQLAVAPYLRYYLRATEGLQIVPNFTAVYELTHLRGNILNEASTFRAYKFIPGLGLHVFIASGIGVFVNGSLAINRNPDSLNFLFDNEKSNQLRCSLGLEYYLSAY